MQNPFLYDRPLPPDQLVDRTAELEQLLQLARAGQSTRIATPRRFGKTTLLGALAETAWSAHEMIPAYVDLSGVTTVDDVALRIDHAYEQGLDRGKLRAVWRGVRRRGTANARFGVPGIAQVGGGMGAPSAEVALARLHDALDLPRLVHARTGQRCLVILDEFQDLLTAEEGLDGVLRSHIQHHSAVASYVFAGSEPSLMAALFGDRRRPLFEQARSVALGPLPLADLADWIDERLDAAGREGLREHVDTAVSLVGGHPQRAMLLAHFLFEQDDDDPDALDGALEGARREARDGLAQTWRALSVAQRRVLGAVARGHDRLLTVAALQATGHAKSTQSAVRRQLLDDAHLRELPGGAVQLVDPLLGLWTTSPQ
ncbi:AAA family ATPase [Patulibacter minatonensis]|uniref:AAA family ATPase n=1 Tax=Patulibacter minatonensis TaxID=298163 RepID=UPI00047E6AF0|nr:hypothetical protein [Patulibacter minatonensis]